MIGVGLMEHRLTYCTTFWLNVSILILGWPNVTTNKLLFLCADTIPTLTFVG